MVKDQSDSEKGNPLPPDWLLFPISSKSYFICTDRIIHTTDFVTPVVGHWLEPEIARWIHPMNDRSDDPSHHVRTLLPRSYISLLILYVSRYWKERKEGNVLFNDALNTFYLRLYGVRHMAKYHTDSERGNPLTPHGLLFPICSKGSFICIIPQTG